MKQQIITLKKKTTVKFPEDWKTYQLGDLGDFLKGKGISKKDRKESGIPCILYGEIYTEHHYYVKEFISFINNKTASKSIRLEKGDILFTGSGETKEEIGKPVAYLKNIEAYAGGDIIILRPKNVDSLFLSYLLNSEHQIKERARLAEGHSVVHIYPKELKSIKVHIPTLLEQRKIAEILSTWDKAIELKEKLIQQKKELKKGLMQKLLTGKLRLTGFKGAWKSVTLGEIAEIYQPKTISQNELKDKGYPVFGANGLIGYYDKYNHETWQTMITCRGSSCGTVNKTTGKAWITGNAMVINVDKTPNIDKNFIYYLCSNQNYKKIIGGSGQPQITKKPLENFKVLIPLDIREQKEIANILILIDNEINLLDKEVNKLEEQKRGLMQLLLTGKVRVKV